MWIAAYLEGFPKAEGREPILFRLSQLTDTIKAYATYLKEFPDGTNAKTASLAHRDLLAWKNAKDTATKDAYRNYLKEFCPKANRFSEAIKLLTEDIIPEIIEVQSDKLSREKFGMSAQRRSMEKHNAVIPWRFYTENKNKTMRSIIHKRIDELDWKEFGTTAGYIINQCKNATIWQIYAACVQSATLKKHPKTRYIMKTTKKIIYGEKKMVIKDKKDLSLFGGEKVVLYYTIFNMKLVLRPGDKFDSSFVLNFTGKIYPIFNNNVVFRRDFPKIGYAETILPALVLLRMRKPDSDVAVAVLRQALYNSDWRIREAAAEALGNLKSRLDDEVRMDLEKLTSDSNKAVRIAATNSLFKLIGYSMSLKQENIYLNLLRSRYYKLLRQDKYIRDLQKSRNSRFKPKKIPQGDLKSLMQKYYHCEKTKNEKYNFRNNLENACYVLELLRCSKDINTAAKIWRRGYVNSAKEHGNKGNYRFACVRLQQAMRLYDFLKNKLPRKIGLRWQKYFLQLQPDIEKWAKQSKKLPPKTHLDFGEGMKLEMTLIQPGKFTRGSKQVWMPRPFYISTKQVPYMQILAFTGQIKAKNALKPSKTLPVEWHVALLYCELASQKAKRTVRLPTQAEWEYAFLSGEKKDPNSWGIHKMKGEEFCMNDGKTPTRDEVDPIGFQNINGTVRKKESYREVIRNNKVSRVPTGGTWEPSGEAYLRVVVPVQGME